MYKYTIFSYYGTIIIVIIVTIWYLWRTLKRKKLVSIAVKSSLEHRINMILKVVLGVGLIIIYLDVTIPAVKDIPYIIEDDLEKAEGIAISSDKMKNDSSWHLRSFIIKDGKAEIKILARTNQVEKGDYFEVRYLPHT